MGGDKEYAEAQRCILNEGFHRGGMFYKCDGKKHDLRAFNVYCCKAFAGTRLHWPSIAPPVT
jgi:hypothetical protein